MQLSEPSGLVEAGNGNFSAANSVERRVVNIVLQAFYDFLIENFENNLSK